MLELAAFLQGHKCRILPLFFGLSCKEFGDMNRRQLWFERWNEWAQEDSRIRVDAWKEALRELDRRKEMEYYKAFGEVAYRKEVVASACSIVHKIISQDQLEFPESCYPALLIFLLIFVMGVVMTFYSTDSQHPLLW